MALVVVDLTDCRPFTSRDRGKAFMTETPEPAGYAWVMTNPRPVKPFLIKGKLHLFEVIADLKFLT
jgi:hypothetical protein